MKDLKLNAYKVICDTLPLLVAILILEFPSDPQFLKLTMLRYLIATFLFISWRSFRRLFFQVRSTTNATWQNYFSVGFLALGTLLILQVLRSKIDLNWFYLVMLAMYATLLVDFFESVKRPFFAVISKFVSVFGLSLLSFVFFDTDITIVVLTFCLSITLILIAQYLSYLSLINMITFSAPSENFKQRQWTLLYSLCSVLAPVILVGLVSYGFLPYQFSLVVLSIPFSGKLIARLNLSDRSDLARAEFFKETSGLSILFAVIIRLIKSLA